MGQKERDRLKTLHEAHHVDHEKRASEQLRLTERSVRTRLHPGRSA